MLCQALAPGDRVHRSPTVGGASAAEEEEGGIGQEATDKNDEEEERLEELDGELLNGGRRPVMITNVAAQLPIF
ncbi:hypothetical protein OsJ_01122 [Oryza sativa Japonica Group]|uniref:Uncharacterized protein n=1 Tax=Oryza sativa subsp. japonica TaxID=39947 RepID=B9EUQ5_ORYSJ|nr:hypothetical protein OsJ_01122 [Oryza sativa Japonica Group]